MDFEGQPLELPPAASDVTWAVKLLHLAARERPGGTETIEPTDASVLNSASMVDVDSLALPAVTMTMIVAALGPAAMGAIIDPSVERVLPFINLSVVTAVAKALAEMPLSVATIKGAVDPEVPNWRQLLLSVREPGEIGSEDWFSTLVMVGRVMENAVDANPELGDEIAAQLSFEV